MSLSPYVFRTFLRRVEFSLSLWALWTSRPPVHRSVLTTSLSESINNSSVQFAKLKLGTVDRCSSANCTNEFLIGAVSRTAPIIILYALSLRSGGRHLSSL